MGETKKVCDGAPPNRVTGWRITLKDRDPDTEKLREVIGYGQTAVVALQDKGLCFDDILNVIPDTTLPTPASELLMPLGKRMDAGIDLLTQMIEEVDADEDNKVHMTSQEWADVLRGVRATFRQGPVPYPLPDTDDCNCDSAQMAERSTRGKVALSLSLFQEGAPASLPPVEAFTCLHCISEPTCSSAWDLYNLNGACLEEK